MRTMFLLFVLCACCLSLPSGVEQDIYIFRGDVDGSGSVDITDPILLNGYLFFGTPISGSCPVVWDTNNDTVINIADPVFLLNFLFTGGPVPYPSVVICHG